ncbi:MAG: MauE/DoxX family redox-associated membrane protein [Aquihabitans sp.]
MSPLAGVLFSAAIVLGVAGVAKVMTPDGTRVALRTVGLPSGRWAVRLLGIVELAITAVALVVAGRIGATLVALTYLGFAGFSALLLARSRGSASCGCFGGTDSPVTRIHVILNVIIAAAVATGIGYPVPGVADTAADTPWAGIPFALLVVLLAWVLQVAFTTLPALQAAERPAPPHRPGTGIAISRKVPT